MDFNLVWMIFFAINPLEIGNLDFRCEIYCSHLKLILDSPKRFVLGELINHVILLSWFNINDFNGNIIDMVKLIYCFY
jgi:hypothetical protein